MTQDLESERELARKAAAGDQAAWRRIFETTSDRLFSLLCFQVGDRDEAKDLLQETYLQAHRFLGSYRGDAPLEEWLRAIAVRKAIDWKRVFLHRIKRSVRLRESTATVEPDIGGVRFDSEDQALREGLAGLSARQRAALLLREWEGRSFREIAQLLGCNESTARVHHTRARERMRAALQSRATFLGSRDWEGQRT
jgi:RNA polymerase sigma-70 factor (ECF subfamily)